MLKNALVNALTFQIARTGLCRISATGSEDKNATAPTLMISIANIVQAIRSCRLVHHLTSENLSSIDLATVAARWILAANTQDFLIWLVELL